MPGDSWLKVKVKDINQLIVKNPSTLNETSSLKDLLEEIVKDAKSRHVYIVNYQNKLIGSVRLNNTLQYMFPTISLLNENDVFQIGSYQVYSSAKSIKDIMTANPSFVYEDTLLSEMVKLWSVKK